VLPAVVCLAWLLDVGCNRPSILAPSGATIALSAPVTALPLNGSTEIVAQINGSVRTPPQRGTLVSFTTTLGVLEPAQAETDGTGRAAVRFRAGSNAGTATITAVSGSADVDESGVIRIAIGSAAVGRVLISADSASAVGGVVKLLVLVVDASGMPLPGITVTLATTSGSLSQNIVTTNARGSAEVFLTTRLSATVTAVAGNQEATATITFVVRPQPTVSIALTDTNNDPRVDFPTSFTITSTPTPSNAITSTAVTFGDGASVNLSGAVASVHHVYASVGSYIVTVTVTDSSGETGSASTVISVR
jgi:hypothetical protein